MEEVEERPNKRKRTDDDDESSDSDSDVQLQDYDMETVQDDIIWMNDGNVVIAAGTNPVRLFKCHKSVLSKHSEVFREMFGGPVAENAEGMQMWQGLPRVDLLDAPDDVQAFLEVLYDATRVPRETSHLKTTDRIAGPLRLAKKYMAEEIFNYLLGILEKDWPCSFDDREVVQRTLHARTSQEFMRRTKGKLSKGGWAFAAFYPDPAPVVRLARELKLNKIYPYAMYELARWYPQGIPHAWDPNDYLRPSHDLLDRADLKCLLEGNQMLKDVLANALDALAESRRPCQCSAPYVDKKICTANTTIWLRVRIKEVMEERKFPCIRDPLHALREMEKEMHRVQALRVDKEGEVCSECREKIRKAITRARAKVWGQIPAIFALPDG